MITIPEQLKKEEFRFIKLQKQSKIPIQGIKWSENLYKYDDEELLKWLKENGNYGVVAGHGDLRILDIDDIKKAEKFLIEFNTFTVKTPGGGFHFYIISKYNKNHVLNDGAGEFRANNYYVVGPGCYAIDNNKKHVGDYKIINNKNAN